MSRAALMPYEQQMSSTVAGPAASFEDPHVLSMRRNTPCAW
ncbi:hypothetical protein ABZ826_36095 [Streptomyces sp. NPDC047515]